MRGLTQHQQNETGRSRWVGGRGKEGIYLTHQPNERTNAHNTHSYLYHGIRISY